MNKSLINTVFIYFLYVQGSPESLVIGAGEGHFGIFIDSNLCQVHFNFLPQKINFRPLFIMIAGAVGYVFFWTKP